MLSQQKTSSFRPERSEVEKSASNPPPANPPRRTGAATFLITLITVTALTLSSPQAHPQGCTQCLDNTAATPPTTQRAYRHAILLLTLTAGGLFATTLALFKRHRGPLQMEGCPQKITRVQMRHALRYIPNDCHSSPSSSPS